MKLKRTKLFLYRIIMTFLQNKNNLVDGYIYNFQGYSKYIDFFI